MRVLTPDDIDGLTLPDLRYVLLQHARVRGPEWKDSILRPIRGKSISELNLQTCRILARQWATVPAQYGVKRIEPGTVKDGIWL